MLYTGYYYLLRLSGWMRAKKLKLKGKAVKKNKNHHPLSLEVQSGLHFQLELLSENSWN